MDVVRNLALDLGGRHRSGRLNGSHGDGCRCKLAHAGAVADGNQASSVACGVTVPVGRAGVGETEVQMPKSESDGRRHENPTRYRGVKSASVDVVDGQLLHPVKIGCEWARSWCGRTHCGQGATLNSRPVMMETE